MDQLIRHADPLRRAGVGAVIGILVLGFGSLEPEPVDARQPGRPHGLRAVAVSPSEVDLSWSLSDAADLYLLRRNGVLLERVIPTGVGAYVDGTVEPGMVYSYSVAAVAADGSVSRPSTSATVRTPALPDSADTTPPSEPESLDATAYSNGVALSWGDANDDTAVTAYRLWRDGLLLSTVDAATLGYIDHAAARGHTIRYTLEALDASGNRSEPSSTTVSGDPSPGLAPSALEPEATASALTTSSVGGYLTALKRYPYLTDLVANYVTVNWGTDRSSTVGSVNWGSVGSDGSCNPTNVVTGIRTATSVNSVSQYQWKATLTLQADKTYCYRVYLNGTDLLGTSASPRFTTQLPAGSTSAFSFAVFGDWGRAPTSSTNQDLSNVMARISESGARFALSVGDNAYESGGQANYGDLYQTGPNISAVFGRNYWAKVGASLPLFAAVGNHGFARSESNLPDLLNWPQDRAVSLSGGKYQKETYCCLNGTSSGSYPSAWYAFDAGAARFYVLTASWTDTNVGTATAYKNDHDYHWSSTRAEYQWLENDLKAHPSALKFAVFHYPIYSDNTSETSDTYLQGSTSLQGLLGRYGVDIAFNGHAHIYQRNRPDADGLVTYVTGGGGAKLSSVRACSAVDAYGIGWSYNDNAGTACGAAPRPASVDHVYHYLLVSVAGTRVTVTPIDELGRRFDVQTYDFGAAPTPDTTPPTAPTALDGFARGARQVDLVWAASTDNTGVTDYQVFRDGSLIGSTAGSPSFSDVGLAPNSTHTYAVKAEDKAANVSPQSASETVTTSTAVTSPVVVAAGDIACAPTDSDYNGGLGTAIGCRQRATSDAVIGTAPDEVLVLGDSQYETGDLLSHQQVYDPTWGRFKAKTQPSVGDHEYQTPNATGYFGYFGAAAGDPAKGYYAYDLGSWRLYALNSNCDSVACAAGSAQEQWLRGDLAAHPSSCVLAYWHHPLFSSGGSYSRTQALWQALYEAGGDLVLTGHEHIYERFAPQNAAGASDPKGIREFVVGSGGKSHHAFSGNPANSEFRDSTTFGVLKLTLRSGGYDWQFVPEAGATLSDQGSGSCGGVTDSQAPSVPGNLAATVRSSTQVDLAWSASTDNVGVTGYDIYRNNAFLKTVGAVTTYSDTTTVAGGTYTYKVRARDAAGNLSSFSAAATATTPPTGATITTYAAVADAYVDQTVPLGNFGTLTRVYADLSPNQQAYLKFTVSGLTAPIQNATLRLYIGDGSADGPSVSLAGNAWSETGVTWSTQPAPIGSRLADAGAVPGATWLEFDVTSAVSVNGDYTFALIATSSDGMSMYSREATTASLRPQLLVTVGSP